MSDLFKEIGAEIKRLGTQGQMELANALFNGHGFVPYGPGQYTPSTLQHGKEVQVPEQEQERESSGRE